MLYPKLISMNTLNFDFGECNFTEKLMLKRDKKGVSREGAGRVAIHRDCPGLIYSYTLECSYCCGSVLNKLEERFDMEKRQFLVETEPVTDHTSYLYKTFTPTKAAVDPFTLTKDFQFQPLPAQQSPQAYQVRFCLPILKDIGRACMVSILDLINANPLPRVSSSS